jgi:hypothetical protein
MDTVEPENVDKAIKECRSCGDSVLTAYLEGGLCQQCRE